MGYRCYRDKLTKKVGTTGRGTYYVRRGANGAKGAPVLYRPEKSLIMETIDRAAVIVTLKNPFYDWAKTEYLKKWKA